MTRITQKQLETLCDRLNTITGSPLASYTRDKDGKYRANIGNYHIDYAYGGATLHRMVNESGGVTTPLSCGYVSKRDLFDRMHAYLRGLQDAKQA